MSAARMSLICWIVYGVMCVAFLPLALGILAVPGLPHAARIPVAVVVVAILWWGPFAYAMYLSGVLKNGDKRLLKRGRHCTAEVLSVKRTNVYVRTGDWRYANRVYKYRLRVNPPGRRPYETDCSTCIDGIGQGEVVGVAVSPHNRKRVAIEPESRSADLSYQRFSSGSGDVGIVVDTRRPDPPSPTAERIKELTKLSGLHKEGEIDDAVYAQERNRLLGEWREAIDGEPTTDDGFIRELAKLSRLHKLGELDDAVYERERTRILGEWHGST